MYRAFLDPVVNKVLEVGSGTVRTYIGSMKDYLAKKKEEKDAAMKKAETSEEERVAVREISDKERKRNEAERRQQLFVRLRPLKQQVEDLEGEIAQLETRHREIEEAMLDPNLYKNGAEAKKISVERKEIEQLIARAYDRWDSIQGEIEKIRNESEHI